MPTVIIVLFMTAVFATGCAPKMAPYRPDYAATHHYPVDQQTLQTDRSLLDVRYQYTLPVYTPVREHRPPPIFFLKNARSSALPPSLCLSNAFTGRLKQHQTCIFSDCGSTSSLMTVGRPTGSVPQ